MQPLGRRHISRLLLASVLLLAPTLRAGDWNATLGGRSERTGLSVETGPRSPVLLWYGSTNAELAQHPVTEGGRVFSTRIENFSDIPHSAFIVAQNLFTGAMLWKTQVPIGFSDSWSTQVLGVRDGQVYASRASNGSNSEYMYALDVRDGSILWVSADLVNQAGSVDSVAFAPNGDVIHGNFQTLVRIDHTNGKTLWRTVRLCPTSSGCSTAVIQNRIYAWEDLDMPDGLHLVISRFDATTGARLYSSAPLKIGLFTIEQIVPLVGPDFTVYAPLADNTPADTFVALQDTGAALQEKWRIPMGYPVVGSFGVGPDGSVYTYSRANEVLRLDPETGQIRNTSSPIPTDSFTLEPRMAIDALGRVYLSNGAASLGGLYSFNPDLTLRWSQSVYAIQGPALGQDGTLVVAGQGTEFRVYQTPPVGASFYTLTPCRLVDTRTAPGPYGGPALAANADRSFIIANQCGIPSTATAVSFNVTITQPTALGDLRLFPAGASLPLVSTLNWRPGQTRANNAIVSLGSSGDMVVHLDQSGGTVHFIIDVNGYFQ